VPAELLHAFLASAAELLPDGRFSVLGGGIDGIVLPAFPAVIPSLAIIVRIRFARADMGVPHSIRALAKKPDGTELSIQTNISCITPPQTVPLVGMLEHHAILNLLITVMHLAFESPGEYSFEFLVDENVIGSLTVSIIANAQIRE
jgi:hypothetical protein